MVEKYIKESEAIANLQKLIELPDDMRVRAIAAVRSAPAEDVAPVVHGQSVIKHRHFGGFKKYTGVDAMCETHTITVDERWECDAKHCHECQALLCSRFENYCPNCGAKMDLEV